MLSKKSHTILGACRLRLPFYLLTNQSTIRYDPLTTHDKITHMIYHTKNIFAYLQNMKNMTKACIVG
jgi:hypothetical protein